LAYIGLDSVNVKLPVFDGAMPLIGLWRFRRVKVGRTVVSPLSRAMVICALSDISLELKDGDRVCLVGHNGAGKTILLGENLNVPTGVFMEDIDEAFHRPANMRQGAAA